MHKRFPVFTSFLTRVIFQLRAKISLLCRFRHDSLPLKFLAPTWEGRSNVRLPVCAFEYRFYSDLTAVVVG